PADLRTVGVVADPCQPRPEQRILDRKSVERRISANHAEQLVAAVGEAAVVENNVFEASARAHAVPDHGRTQTEPQPAEDNVVGRHAEATVDFHTLAGRVVANHREIRMSDPGLVGKVDLATDLEENNSGTRCLQGCLEAARTVGFGRGNVDDSTASAAGGE